MSGQWPKDIKEEIKVSKERDKTLDYNPSTGHEAAARAKTPGAEVQWDEVACVQKAKGRGDLTFTLVGQDLTSPEVICFWILMNIQTCPAPKLQEALDKAIKMRDIPADKRKSAD